MGSISRPLDAVNTLTVGASSSVAQAATTLVSAPVLRFMHSKHAILTVADIRAHLPGDIAENAAPRALPVASSAQEPPRLVSETEAAQIIRWSSSEFSRRRGELEAIGFPRRHPVLKRRDHVAIHRWLDEQFGLAKAPRDVDGLIKARLANLGKRA